MGDTVLLCEDPDTDQNKMNKWHSHRMGKIHQYS